MPSKTETLDGVRDSAAQLVQSVIEQAAARAMGLGDVGERAEKSARRSFRSARKTISSTETPSVREVALNAASAALELWQVAKEKAEAPLHTAEDKVIHTAVDLKDATASKAKDVTESIAHSAKDVSGTIAHGAKDVSETIASGAKEVTGSISSGAHVAASTGKQAAVATAETSASVLRTAFWLSAASAIVYWVFLDEERQKEVRKVALEIVNQARELAGDLRGQDGEFA